MDIYKKAMDAYEENRKRPQKLRIEDECWADWYAAGYKQAIKDMENKNEVKNEKGEVF